MLPVSLDQIKYFMATKHKQVKLVKGQAYKGNKMPLLFSCNKHGEFESTWNAMQKSVTGCRLCGIEYKTDKRRSSAKEQIAELAKLFPKLEQWEFKDGYVNNMSMVTYVCPEHGERTKALRI